MCISICVSVCWRSYRSSVLQKLLAPHHNLWAFWVWHIWPTYHSSNGQQIFVVDAALLVQKIYITTTIATARHQQKPTTTILLQFLCFFLFAIPLLFSGRSSIYHHLFDLCVVQPDTDSIKNLKLEYCKNNKELLYMSQNSYLVCRTYFILQEAVVLYKMFVSLSETCWESSSPLPILEGHSPPAVCLTNIIRFISSKNESLPSAALGISKNKPVKNNKLN